MSRPEPFCRLQFDETLSGYLGRLAMKLGLDLADRDVHPGLKKRLEELGYKKDIHPIALAAHFSGVSSQVVSEFHTVLPFLEALSEKRSRLFSEIPIPTNVKSGIELGHIFPAKVCPACVRRDLRKLGCSYWRRSHQVPGLVVCTRHWERLHLADSVEKLVSNHRASHRSPPARMVFLSGRSFFETLPPFYLFTQLLLRVYLVQPSTTWPFFASSAPLLPI